MPPAYAFRSARSTDYDPIIAVVDAWWGRPMAGALQRLFLDHLAGTSLVAELPGAPGEPARMVAFLIGFPSPDRVDEAYIHFVGVDPDQRGSGLGRALYEEFFDAMRLQGRSVVHAVTSPVNVGSIAFHRAMGFDASGPVVDYDGPGADRVVFVRTI